MAREFTTVDYEATLDTAVRLGDCLPQDHLARFVADTISELDLSALYGGYGTRGGQPYAPEILLGLLFYAYATGMFSSRKIEQATRDTAAFRFLAGNLSPDHDTLASFRKRFLGELRPLFVQILLLAQEMGLLALGNISLDGTKIHADASKSKAVSYKRLREIETKLALEIDELLVMAEQADQSSAVPEGMDLPQEIARRQDRLQRLAQAKAALEARAAERFLVEQAEHEARMRERADAQERTGKKPGGKPPASPTPGPRDTDQFNFTDPDSRIMKNSRDGGFGQHYNAQAAVDQQAMLIVGYSLSNHANDQQEAEPTLHSIPTQIGVPPAAALDCGYFSQGSVAACEAYGTDPHIATGRDVHNLGWRRYFAQADDPPAPGASLRELMAHKLRTLLGKSIYSRRKCTVEPVIGQIKEAMGFRQFSLRGLAATTGEWCLVCLAFNLRRLHVLSAGILAL